MTDRDQQMLDANLSQFDLTVKEIAQKLRVLAREIEQTRITDRNGVRRSPANIAAEVVHQAQWGFANLPLSTLITGAGYIYDLEAEIRKQSCGDQ